MGGLGGQICAGIQERNSLSCEIKEVATKGVLSFTQHRVLFKPLWQMNAARKVECFIASRIRHRLI